jgi:hypothetical protein
MAMKKYLIGSLLLGLFLMTPKASNAYELLGGYYSEKDSIRFYIDQSVKNKNYGGYAIHGANGFQYNSNITVVGDTTNISNSQFRFYYNGTDTGDYATNTNYEHTIWGYNPCNNCEYDKSDIVFYKSFDGLTDTRKKEAAVHEVGHAWGLDHEDDTPAIMMSGPGFLDSVYPIIDDHNGINAIY